MITKPPQTLLRNLQNVHYYGGSTNPGKQNGSVRDFRPKIRPAPTVWWRVDCGEPVDLPVDEIRTRSVRFSSGMRHSDTGSKEHREEIERRANGPRRKIGNRYRKKSGFRDGLTHLETRTVDGGPRTMECGDGRRALDLYHRATQCVLRHCPAISNLKSQISNLKSQISNLKSTARPWGKGDELELVAESGARSPHSKVPARPALRGSAVFAAPLRRCGSSSAWIEREDYEQLFSFVPPRALKSQISDLKLEI